MFCCLFTYVNISKFLDSLQELFHTNNHSTILTMHNNSIHKCYTCHAYNALKASMIPLAHQQNDNFYEEKHFLCQQCQNEFNNIQKYVRQNNLTFGNTSFVGRNIMKFTQLCNKPNNNEQLNESQQSILIDEDYLLLKTGQQPFYEQQIKDIIIKEKFYQTGSLSNKIKYLVYCSSYQIPTAQRHERVKNMVLRLSVDLAVSIQELQNLSILVQIFLCFMNDAEIYEFMNSLWDNFYNSDIENGWTKLRQIIDCTKIKQQLSQLFSLKLSSQNKKQDRNQNMSVTQQLGFKQQYHLQDLSQSTPLSSTQKKTKRTLNLDFSLQQSNENNENFEKETLKELHRMKNRYLLLISSLQEQDQRNQEIIKEMQKKFKNQKEQYITTILALKQRIAQLEDKANDPNYFCELQKNGVTIHQQSKQRSQRNSHDSSIERVKMKALQKLRKMHMKSFTQNRENMDEFKQTSRSFQSNNKQYFQIKSFVPQPQIQDQSNPPIIENYKLQTDLDYFDMSINALKDSINLQEKFIKEARNHTSQSQRLYRLILQANQEIQRQQKKWKQSDSQIKRLLTIIKRKQQRMVPLLHQKDQQIQIYENALWRLENGIPMENNKLANRIERILLLISARANKDQNSDNIKPKPKVKKIKKKVSQKKIDEKQQQPKTQTQPKKTQLNIEHKDRCIIY